jgi:hypothetical protein
MARQLGFRSANMMIENNGDRALQETVDAQTQLAIAAASDGGNMATPNATESKLTIQLEANSK